MSQTFTVSTPDWVQTLELTWGEHAGDTRMGKTMSTHVGPRSSPLLLSHPLTLVPSSTPNGPQLTRGEVQSQTTVETRSGTFLLCLKDDTRGGVSFTIFKIKSLYKFQISLGQIPFYKFVYCHIHVRLHCVYYFHPALPLCPRTENER